MPYPYVISRNQLAQSKKFQIESFAEDRKKDFHMGSFNLVYQEDPLQQLSVDYARFPNFKIQDTFTANRTVQECNDKLKELCDNTEVSTDNIGYAYSQNLISLPRSFFTHNYLHLEKITPVKSKSIKGNLYKRNNKIYLEITTGNFTVGLIENQKTFKDEPEYTLPGTVTTHYIYDPEAMQFQLEYMEVSTPVLYKLMMEKEYIPENQEVIKDNVQPCEFREFYRNFEIFLTDINVNNLQDKLYTDVTKNFPNAQIILKKHIQAAIEFFNAYPYPQFTTYENMVSEFIQTLPAELSSYQKTTIENLAKKASQAFTYRMILQLAQDGKNQLDKSPKQAEEFYQTICELKTKADNFFYGFNTEQKLTQVETFQFLEEKIKGITKLKLEKSAQTIVSKEIGLYALLDQKINEDFKDPKTKKAVHNHIHSVINFINQHEYTDPDEFEHLVESLINYRPRFEKLNLTDQDKEKIINLEFKATQIFINNITHDLIKHADKIKVEDPAKAKRIHEQAAKITAASNNLYRGNHNQDTRVKLFDELEQQLLYTKKTLNDPRNQLKHQLLRAITNILVFLTVIGAFFILRKKILFDKGKASSPLLFAQTTSSKIAGKGVEAVQELKKTALLLFKKPGGGSSD